MKKYEKPKFDHDGQMGEFDWGEDREEIFERFYDACDFQDREFAVKELESIILADPYFIDAYNSLGWIAFDYLNYGSCLFYFEKAYKIGNSLIPKTFKGEIIWGIVGNRSFLRAVEGIGMTYMYINDHEKALKYFEKNLKFNPNDNQGIRGLAISSYLALGDYKNVLKICNWFNDDILPETLYGKVIANYYLDNLKEAGEALQHALLVLPSVAKELISVKHKTVHSEHPESITVGSAFEAYLYWKRNGIFWTNPKLKEFLKAGLHKINIK